MVRSAPHACDCSLARSTFGLRPPESAALLAPHSCPTPALVPDRGSRILERAQCLPINGLAHRTPTALFLLNMAGSNSPVARPAAAAQYRGWK
jgi:hypothetical protein